MPPPNLFDLIWPWPLTSWPPKLTVSCLALWTTCTNWHQNQFIRFQNIICTSLVTDELTTQEHNYSSAGQSGIAEVQKLTSRSDSFFFCSTSVVLVVSVAACPSTSELTDTYALLSFLRLCFSDFGLSGKTMSFAHADLLDFDLWTSRNSWNSTLFSSCNKSTVLTWFPIKHERTQYNNKDVKKKKILQRQLRSIARKLIPFWCFGPARVWPQLS